MPILPIVLMINLGVGCTSVIADFKASKQDALNPEKIYRQLVKYRVKQIVSSPLALKKIAGHIIHQNYKDLTLTKIFTGGAPVFPNEAQLYLKTFPNSQIEIVYGSTEAEPISSINANELSQNLNNPLTAGLSVGIPYRKTEVRIISIQDNPIYCDSIADLQKLTLSAGIIGEILVSGPHVLSEYFNNEEALKRNKIFIEDSCWHKARR